MMCIKKKHKADVIWHMPMACLDDSFLPFYSGIIMQVT
jgi:hypothetical protein